MCVILLKFYIETLYRLKMDGGNQLYVFLRNAYGILTLCTPIYPTLMSHALISLN
jgi:hypothetical protein